MPSRFLEPNPDGLRRPDDDQKVNGQMLNPPRFAELGGLDRPLRVKEGVPYQLFISKPDGGRK